MRNTLLAKCPHGYYAFNICPRCDQPQPEPSPIAAAHPTRPVDEPSDEILEPLDGAAMWGVFNADGYSLDPIAMFKTQDDAREWLKMKQDADEMSVDECVIPVYVEKATGANHCDDAAAIEAIRKAHPGGRWE